MTHVLVVGGGGREHALAWKLAQSPRVSRLSVAPGNAGTAALARNIDVDATDIVSLLDYAESEGVDFTVVGPEEPLAGGLVDQFQAAGLRVFGPDRSAALIETSKSYAKELMVRHGVPTAPYETFTELEPALDHVMTHRIEEMVIKADGLARGKGVFLPRGTSDAEGILRALLERDALRGAGRKVIVERRLTGPEVSVMSFTDGETLAVMPPVTDFKRLSDDDRGPNTGGMGGFAPTPALTARQLADVRARIIEPVLAGLRADACCFRGVLAVGIVLTDEGPMALELNARFGDPSAQTVLPLLASDLLDVVEACTNGGLEGVTLAWYARVALSVVVATESYPERSDPDLAVGLPGDLPPDVLVFHAGTRAIPDGTLLTTGGRVLGVTALATDVATAASRAYEVVRGVRLQGAHFRTDIGTRTVRA